MSRTAIPNEEAVAPARRPHLGALSSCVLRHQGDDRLVMLTRAGSERAFAEIMRRYERPLYVYCLQLLGAGRAEDAVQQTFLKAFVALRDGASREITLRPWLYRIARNCSIDLLRKHDSDHDELDPEYEDMPQSLAPALFEQKEELAKVVAGILALPEGQRRALTLRVLEGRSYGEISAALGHTDSGVRQLIFRARTALRNLAAVAFPFGSLRSRFLAYAGPGPADAHQVAAAASLSPAGNGGPLETVGSILAATLTLAAGGGPAASAHRHVPKAEPVVAYVATPPALAPVASANAAKSDETRSPRHRRVNGPASATPAIEPVTTAPVPASVALPAPVAAPPATAVLSPEPPATVPAPPSGTDPGTAAAPRAQNLEISETSTVTPTPGSVPEKGTTGPAGAIPPAKKPLPPKPKLTKPIARVPAKPIAVAPPLKPAKPVKPPKSALPKTPKLPATTR